MTRETLRAVALEAIRIEERYSFAADMNAGSEEKEIRELAEREGYTFDQVMEEVARIGRDCDTLISNPL